MTFHSEESHILVIDAQEHWRKLATQSLEEAGHTVTAIDSYTTVREIEWETAAYDLVLLGCPRIGEKEQKLIEYLLANRQKLLVLCTSLPLHTIRDLFVAGVKDVSDKPYKSVSVIRAVDEVLGNLSNQDNYQSFEREAANNE